MTIQSPDYILMNTFSSAISYSLEILEEEDTPVELLALVTRFLQQAAKLNEVAIKRNEANKLLKDVKEVKF